MLSIKNSIKFGSLLVLFFLLLGFNNLTLAKSNDTSRSILKIQSYDESDGGYYIDRYGSAIVVDKDTLVTNAHVVIKEDNTPYYNYEICGHIYNKKNIMCFDTAKLVYIDTEKDLAILKFSNKSNFSPVIFSTKELLIGDNINVYGYSFDGLGNITASHGIVSNYYGKYIGLDADIDQGDSGGGVVDLDGKIGGMPTFILLYNIQGDVKKSNYMIPSSDIVKFINSYKKDSVGLSQLHLPYYATTRYQSFISYINYKQKQQSLGYIKTNDFYLLYQGYGFELFDVAKSDKGYTYMLKNIDQNVEIYLNKYKNISIKDTLSGYLDQLSGNYDMISISDLTYSVTDPDINRYIKIVGKNNNIGDRGDYIHLIQKDNDLIFLEIFGDQDSRYFTSFIKKIDTLARNIIR